MPPSTTDALLRCSQHRAGDSQVVELVGELDLANADVLRDSLQLAAESGTGVTVVDLSALEFIDSSGVAVILQATRRAEVDGRSLRLVGVHGAPRRVFEVLGLNHLLDADPTSGEPGPAVG